MTKRFAILDASSIVENVVLADDPLDQSWVDLTGIDPQPGPGWSYSEGVFTPPPAPPPPPPLPNIITKVAMLTHRLKTAEFVGILTAAKTDPGIEAWKYVFDAATVVDLDSQNTRDGMTMMVAKGLLTQARADAILTDPVQPGERPS